MRPKFLPRFQAWKNDDDNSREKLVNQIPAQNETKDLPNAEARLAPDEDDEEIDDSPELGKPSKKKLFFAFVCFVCFFVLLIAALCWFFGIGFFAQPTTKKIDRTAKASAQTAPVTDEEKLKLALNMVAEKDPNGSANSNTIEKPNVAVSDVSTNNPLAESSITIPNATRATDLNGPVVVSSDLGRQVNGANNNSVTQTTSSESGETSKNQIERNTFAEKTNLCRRIVKIC